MNISGEGISYIFDHFFRVLLRLFSLTKGFFDEKRPQSESQPRIDVGDAFLPFLDHTDGTLESLRQGLPSLTVSFIQEATVEENGAPHLGEMNGRIRSRQSRPSVARRSFCIEKPQNKRSNRLTQKLNQERRESEKTKKNKQEGGGREGEEIKKS